MSDKYHSADLILKLYDLRREETMRKARNWIFSYTPASAEEYMATMMDPEVGGYLRMVTSYWDMAAALVNSGAIDRDMFYETNGEYLHVFAKIEPMLNDLRAAMQSPDAFKNLEKLIDKQPNGRETLKMVQEWHRSLASGEDPSAGSASSATN